MAGQESTPRLPLPLKLAATLLGAGLAPVMPGTCGTLAAALPVFFLPEGAYPFILGGAALLATLGCILISRRMGRADPGWFVLDEAAGFYVAAFWTVRPEAWRIALAFLFFRIFDILKPWPIRRLEKVDGGLGIVLDDLLAGAYALGLASAAGAILS